MSYNDIISYNLIIYHSIQFTLCLYRHRFQMGYLPSFHSTNMPSLVTLQCKYQIAFNALLNPSPIFFRNLCFHLFFNIITPALEIL
jgi:hypothetical protein